MSSIQERIAALNLSQVARTASPSSTAAPTKPKPRAPPPPPTSPPPRHHSDDAVVQCRSTQPVGNQPAHQARPPVVVRPPPSLPPRPSAAPPPPSLPPRSSITTHPASHGRPPVARRESATSIGSSASAVSAPSTATSLSDAQEIRAVKAPAFDPSKLPALPPKRSKEEQPKKRPALPTRTSTASTSSRASNDTVVSAPRRLPPTLDAQSLPPTRPWSTRNTHDEPEDVADDTSTPSPAPVQAAAPSRPTPRQPAALARSALAFGMNKTTEQTPSIPTRPSADTPPPIPTASKPRVDAAPPQAVPNTSLSSPPPTASCLLCRDFSGPDAHAARFPRQAIPSTDIHWLANALASPFASPTDKARVIFTWLHHNVAYDCPSFFAGTIRPSTPASTIASGLAVCEGYAGLYAALCVAAGLSCIVASGHGKGFGYTAGTPCPAKPDGHAWNAVQIDGGEWKLVDPCWGAGTVGEGRYTPGFNPTEFTKSNADFGRTHYPSNPAWFYLSSPPPSFQAYWSGALDGVPPGQVPVQEYGSVARDHGIAARSIHPRAKAVSTASGRHRFEFTSVCEHWDNARHGQGDMYVIVLLTHGRGGDRDQALAFQTDGQRRHWWLDVDAAELGRPGQDLMCAAVTSVDGRDARGWSVPQFEAARGKKGMGFGGVCGWVLV